VLGVKSKEEMASVVKRKLPDWIMSCKKKRKTSFAVIFHENHLRELVHCMETAFEMMNMGREARIDYLFEDDMSDFHFIANCGLWNVLDMEDVLRGLQYMFPNSGDVLLDEVRMLAHDENKMVDLIVRALDQIKQAHFWQVHLIGI